VRRHAPEMKRKCKVHVFIMCLKLFKPTENDAFLLHRVQA
jgi:hypothetical protein